MPEPRRDRRLAVATVAVLLLLFGAAYIYLGSGEPDPDKLDATPLSVTPEPAATP